MESRLLSLALSILDDLKSRFKLTSQAVREAIRLAALNMLLSLRYGHDAGGEELEYPFFEELSFGGESSGLSRSEVLELTNAIVEESITTKWSDGLSGLTVREFADLLSYTHSLSCFTLPNGQYENMPRRWIGAFYTPREVTDYIVRLTVSPLLLDVERNKQISSQEFPKIIDPACGTGAFLNSAADLLKQRYGRCLDSTILCEKVRSSLFGIDLDAGALEVAKVSFEIIMHPSRFPLKEHIDGPSLKKGNSLISIKGWHGQSSHDSFFGSSSSRFPLEWKHTFPAILGNNGLGFDAVVMNPPYQRLKPNLAEFMRDRLLKGDRTIQMAEYENQKQLLAEDVKYYRESGEFKFGNRYTIDTYRLFIERALQITRDRGRVGFVVPSSLLGDLSATKLRNHLLDDNRIEVVREFSESGKLFSGVTQSVCIMVVEKGGTTRRINASFGLQDVEGARSDKGYVIDASRISEFTGISQVIPRVPDTGWKVFECIHRHPSLGSLIWMSNRRGELDLTLNKQFILEGSSGFPLVRGSRLSRYALLPPDCRKAESVDSVAFLKSLGTSKKAGDPMKWRIACQQVSNRLQHWRLKFALIPPESILGNSCNYITISDKVSRDRLYYLLAILNSHLLNWRFEVSNTNNHVSNHELSRMPIPDPQGMSSAEREAVRTIVKLAKKRIAGEEELEPVLEASVLSLFGLSRIESSNILRFRSVDDLARRNILKHLG